MISHKEAEILTSARQDAPLDPVVERALQAHLATCDECRAFAIATERLTAGIKAMPSIPVNPRTRREVMEQVQRGRNPFTGFLAAMGGGFQSGPVLAAAASIVIIGLFGWLALDRLVFDDGDTDSNQLAAVPTEQAVERFVASPTQVAPTETVEPTDVPEEPTATTVPTDVPEEPTATTEPTATEEPEPTATTPPVPTATSEPEPTATEEAAIEDDGDGPTDLTTMTQLTATDVPVEPTATVAPTSVPTEEPTVAPTEEPTAEPEPTNTPAIEPMNGTGVEDQPTPTEVPDGVGSGPDQGSSQIEPSGDVQTPEGADNQEQTTAVIEPIDGDVDESDSTPDDDEQSLPEGQSLADASVSYSYIAGDASGLLGLTRDGRLEFMAAPDSASRTTSGGYRLDSADSQPGVVQLCGDGFCEPALDPPESESWQGDAPLGVIGQNAYFLRLYSDRTEVYAAVPEGTQFTEAVLLAEFGPIAGPGAVYENNGIMFTWLPTGEWLEISDGRAQLFSGGYGNPTNLRFAPMASNGPLIGYFSNGTLIIAPVTAPDSPVFSMPTDGIDFDLTGSGDRVAVIRGNDIVIYDIQGNQLAMYLGGDRQPGSLIWLNSGIVYVDRSSGALYQIPETAP